jgi:glyoxylase-like metal-dependent hydrolase (beta-lactamase superfamily II)
MKWLFYLAGLAAVIGTAGCVDTHHHRDAYGGAYEYPEYSRGTYHGYRRDSYPAYHQDPWGRWYWEDRHGYRHYVPPKANDDDWRWRYRR